LSHDIYTNPLITRYASQEMSQLFSPQRRHSTWRQLWVALAESQKELGLDITDEQIAELKSNIHNIDFENAARHEKETRHDVMAHVHAYKDQCPNAGPIIHLGATSCYVTDNAELVLIREALQLLRGRLVAVIDALASFAEEHRDLPTLGFTHLQPAQPTTVGKRATLWCYDLALDLEEVEHRLQSLRFRGVKGTTGTQATFLTLFDDDHAKVLELDRLVTQKMGFTESYAVTGQTYSRKIDSQFIGTLSGIAQSGHKAGSDIRILQNRKEVEEPFEKHQIGSSAMAYKRNPMRTERMCSLARFAMSMQSNADQTFANQWMERTLDDSANRRLSLPLACLSVDAVLILYLNVAKGLVVYPKTIAKNLNEELPFMATEEILMDAVQAGGDRQVLHEIIRVHSQAAAKRVKEEAASNDLISRLKEDKGFENFELGESLDAKRFIGRAAEQVDEFISQVVQPIREKYGDSTITEVEVNV
jgi:adenylosuccinate lyase